MKPNRRYRGNPRRYDTGQKRKAASGRYAGMAQCRCGKMIYTSRKDARAAARVLLPGDTQVSTFSCHEFTLVSGDPIYHFGHMPKEKARDGFLWDRSTGRWRPARPGELPTDVDNGTDEEQADDEDREAC